MTEHKPHDPKHAHMSLAPEEFSTRLFSPRGRYSGHRAGQIVHSDVVGPINEEFFREFGPRLHEFYAAVRADGSFAAVTHFHESMLMSPRALDAFTVLITDLVHKGIGAAAVAYVADPEVEGRWIMEQTITSKIVRPLGFPFRLFERVDAAEQWARDQLAQPS